MFMNISSSKKFSEARCEVIKEFSQDTSDGRYRAGFVSNTAHRGARGSAKTLGGGVGDPLLSP